MFQQDCMGCYTLNPVINQLKANGIIHLENWPSQSSNKRKLLECTNEESER